MILNGVVVVILRYFTESGSLGANYVAMVEISCLRQKCSARYLFFSNIWLMAIFSEIAEKERESENVNCANTARPSQRYG